MIHLRRARAGDEMAVAAVHVSSWRTAYRGLVDQAYLDSLRPEDRAARYTFETDLPLTVVALTGARVIGFATVGPARDVDCPRFGEVYALYVDPAHWSTGVGKELMADARRRLVGLGHRSALLWVLTGNLRAERFYRFDGWRPDGSCRVDDGAGILLAETRYVRPLV